MKLDVKILVTVPDQQSFDACTLCFKSLRVGFPTANISVDINPPARLSPVTDTSLRVVQKAVSAGAGWHLLPEKVHLADWIRRQVEDADDQLVILDADTVFYKSCEGMEVPGNTLLAGYYIPRIWNDFSKCVSVPRIHTSFMFFPDPAGLREAIREAYPPALQPHGEYCPCDPYMPAVRFLHGRPVFWDCCANLYEMLGKHTYSFGPQHLACYDHINSASFYDVMLDRLENKEGFAYLHRFLTATPEKIREANLWRLVNAYYQDKAAQADDYECLP